MIIEIDADWKIQSAPLEWTLLRKRVAGIKAKNPGEVSWDVIGHYGSIPDALKGATEHILRAAETTVELDGLVHECSRVESIVRTRLQLHERI